MYRDIFPLFLCRGIDINLCDGVWDPDTKRWCTVAKCGNGHGDKTIEKLNKEQMTKISKVFRVFLDLASPLFKKAKRMNTKSNVGNSKIGRHFIKFANGQI